MNIKSGNKFIGLTKIKKGISNIKITNNIYK